ncbi:MAG: glycosyltransferase family 1 protein [Porphyromonadaceae bacterium]|nr:glycosyltransferase family 1 protein [Porphyromonadaceae bacterium]
MNIAFDAKRITSNATGLGNYSRYIVGALAEYYPESNYLLCAPSVGNPRLYEELLRHRSVTMHTPEGSLGKLLGAWWRNRGVKSVLLREEVDIYHGLSNELPYGLFREKRIGTVVTIHDLAFVHHPEFYSSIDRVLYRQKYRASARAADHVIAVSEFTRRDLIEMWGVEEDRVSVVYQGCSPRFAQMRPEEIAFARGHYQLPERYILFVGSIEERKNLRLVVRALAALRDKGLHLLAIGRRTPYCDAVMSEARRLGVMGQVRLMHQVPTVHLPGIYGGAEVFVYPSRFEGFGIPLIEALNAGVPVIGATGSCLEEAGGPYSLYTDPDDADMLSDLIFSVIDSPSQRAKMVREGRSYAQRFNPKQIVRELRSVYENVLLTHD